LELAKPVLTGGAPGAIAEMQAMTAWVRDEILKLLHPFMPFITEELWRVTAEEGPKRASLLALASWPKHDALSADDAEAEIGWVIDLVSAVRSLRAEMNITMATEVPLVLVGVSAETEARAGRWSDVIKRLARLSRLSMAPSAPAGAVQLVVRGEVAALPLVGVIDFAAEEARLNKELARAVSDIARVDGKLANQGFMRNAAEEVIEAEREKREEAEGRRKKLEEALARLRGAADPAPSS
jgi:valyl-tRNA synthetase